jgi:hypothetical protein
VLLFCFLLLASSFCLFWKNVRHTHNFQLNFIPCLIVRIFTAFRTRKLILSRVWVWTVFGVIIAFIKFVYTMRDYTFHYRYYTHISVHSQVFTSRCSIAASNGGRSLFSKFPNYLRPQLPASQGNSSQRLNLSSSLTYWFINSVTHQQTNSTQLNWLHFTNCPAYDISARTVQITPSYLCYCIQVLCSCLCDAHVIASQPVPSNGRCLQNNYLATAVA